MHSKRFHHIFDLSNCSDIISNADRLKAFIEKLAEVTKMHILAGPTVVAGIPENPGLSGFAIVDFSHISVHTFTDHNEALIDIFSCKEYDRDAVEQACMEHFATPATEVRHREVYWG